MNWVSTRRRWRTNTYERTVVRAVALNDKNEIALINFANIQSSKAFGGGVDEGEDLEVALAAWNYRRNWLRNRWNTYWYCGWWYYSGMHQMSYCYIVRVGDFIGTNPTTKELARGIQTKWFADIDSAIKLLNNHLQWMKKVAQSAQKWWTSGILQS